MPSLNVVFTGNAGPLNAVMTEQVGKVKAFQRAIAQSSLSPEAKQAAYAKLALDEELNRRIVNNETARQAIRKRRVAAEMADIAAGSGGFGWVKKAGEEAMEDVGAGAARAGKHVGGLNLILRESLVVLREIGRGNWSRVPGSVSMIVQGFAQLKGISLATLGVWGAAIAVSAGLIYERFWGLKKLLKDLSFDVSNIDIGSSFIPKMERHINDAAKAQRELNDEIRKTVEKYNSAAEAARRVADVTKEHFDHLRRMNDLSNAPESVKTRRELEIDQMERAQEIANKEAEQAALQVESQKKLTEARQKYGHLTSKEEDVDTQKKLDAKAEAAQKFLQGGGFWEEVQKRAASLGGLDKSVVDQLNAAGDAGTDLANKFIKDANAFKDKTASNDIFRGYQKELTDAATKAAAEAAQIGLDLPNMRARAAQKNADQAEENRAKLLAKKISPDLTANQRIGAFAYQQNTQIDLARQSLQTQRDIKTGIDALNAKPGGIPGYGGN
jgi:hypothetical protein